MGRDTLMEEDCKDYDIDELLEEIAALKRMIDKLQRLVCTNTASAIEKVEELEEYIIKLEDSMLSEEWRLIKG